MAYQGYGRGLDLEQVRQELMSACAAEIEHMQAQHGLQSISVLAQAEETRISYPVLEYPDKVKSFNLDKTPTIAGTLMGIKGQYLIFDNGVINMRKYGGYHLTLTLD